MSLDEKRADAMPFPRDRRTCRRSRFLRSVIWAAAPALAAGRRSGAVSLLLFFVGTIGFGAGCHADAPHRIVSLNLCVDQILIELVPRDRIVGVTHLAADPAVSAVPGLFAGLSATRGDAEDVIGRRPDLVIAGSYSTPTAVDLLRRLGRRVVVVPIPQSLSGIAELITTMAAAVEEPAAGARLVAEFNARLARVKSAVARSPAMPTAVVYQINNYVAGRGGLIDEALRTAGFVNAGGDVPTFAGGKTDLETIVAAPPDLMVLATRPGEYATVVGDNLRHPALASVLQRTRNLVLSWPLWLCGTQHIATAIEQLAAARAGFVAEGGAGP